MFLDDYHRQWQGIAGFLSGQPALSGWQNEIERVPEADRRTLGGAGGSQTKGFVPDGRVADGAHGARVG